MSGEPRRLRMSPNWCAVLRALREARGLTQDGWALALGFGRATVQRWESGAAVPNAEAERSIIALCEQRGLFHGYGAGPLRGVELTPELLRTMLEEARFELQVDTEGSSADGQPDARQQRRISPHAWVGGTAPSLPPSVLPAPVSSLAGRKQELAEVGRLLERSRLVTLTGAGGAGKTRLALEAAALRAGFPDGTFFVDLARVADPELVASAIAQVLRIHEVGSRPVIELLTMRLAERRVLLLLDNFEHLAEAAPTVADLLAACPRLTVLATSRAPLHLRGEQELTVPPLPTPDPDRMLPVALLLAYPAIALFIERTRAMNPNFALTEANAFAVASICHRLDGLPLAIELAAARGKVLPPAALLARLDRRLPLLNTGSRDLPVRQQTLRNTIAWSFGLLEPAEQALFRRLSVFAGGCSLDAAAAVCNANGDLELEILDGVAALADKSLLRYEDGADREPRFRMLQTVREFAGEQLEQSGEAAAVRTAHLRLMRRRAQPALNGFVGTDPVAWLAEMEAEIDNIRAALSWALTDPDAAYDGLALAGALQPLWAQAHLQEGCAWLERLLAPGTGASTPARAGALLTAAQLVMYRSGYAAAVPFIDECLSLSRSLDRKAVLAQGLCLRAEGFRIDAAAAQIAAGEAVALALELGDPTTLLRANLVLGTVACWQGELGLARSSLEAAVSWGQRAGLHVLVGAPLRELGNVAYREGDYPTARRLLEESIELFTSLGVDSLAAQSLPSLGRVALAEGKTEEATELLLRTLSIEKETGSVAFVTLAISGLALVALEQQDLERSTRLFGAAEALGTVIPPLMGNLYENEHVERLASLRQQLGAGAFSDAWASGRSISLDDALDGALVGAALA